MSSMDSVIHVVVLKQDIYEALVYYVRALELRFTHLSDFGGMVTLHLTGGVVYLDLTTVREGYSKHQMIL